MSNTAQNIALNPRKVKPIIRITPHKVETQKHLRILLKKGTKAKSILLSKEYGKMLLEDPRNHSFIRRLTKYCSNLHSLHASCLSTKHIKLLPKIQYKIRYIQDLHLGPIDWTKTSAHKRLKNLLKRLKFLKTYKSEKSEPEVPGNRRVENHQKKITTCLTFHKRESFDQNGSIKARQLIFDMRKHLISIDTKQGSIALTVDMPFDRERDEFNRRLFRLIDRYSFEEVTLPDSFEEDYGKGVYKALSFFQEKNLNVRCQLDLRYLFNEESMNTIEKYLARKDAKLMISPTNYSWGDFVMMLNFSQRMFSDYGSLIGTKDITFNFHSTTNKLVSEALATHVKQMDRKWDRFVFIFQANSPDWFKEERKLCLKEMMNTMCKEKKKYSEIHFHVDCRIDFSKDLFEKATNEIFSVIQDVVVGQEEARYVLKIDFECTCDKSFLTFLDQFKRIPKRIDVLHLNLFGGQVSNFNRIFWNLDTGNYRMLVKFLPRLNELIQSTQQLWMRAEKIKRFMDELKENNPFKEYFQLDEITELLEKLIESKKEEERKEEFFKNLRAAQNRFSFA